MGPHAPSHLVTRRDHKTASDINQRNRIMVQELA
jgi:hypothetical protein